MEHRTIKSLLAEANTSEAEVRKILDDSRRDRDFMASISKTIKAEDRKKFVRDLEHTAGTLSGDILPILNQSPLRPFQDYMDLPEKLMILASVLKMEKLQDGRKELDYAYEAHSLKWTFRKNCRKSCFGLIARLLQEWREPPIKAGEKQVSEAVKRLESNIEKVLKTLPK